jgi:hypothetical protein
MGARGSLPGQSGSSVETTNHLYLLWLRLTSDAVYTATRLLCEESVAHHTCIQYAIKTSVSIPVYWTSALAQLNPRHELHFKTTKATHFISVVITGYRKLGTGCPQWRVFRTAATSLYLQSHALSPLFFQIHINIIPIYMFQVAPSSLQVFWSRLLSPFLICTMLKTNVEQNILRPSNRKLTRTSQF